MQIFKISLKDQSTENLTNTRFDNIHSSISSNGRMMLYRSDKSGNFEIELRDLEQSGSRQVSEGTGSKRHPSFGPEDRFAFYQNVIEPGNAEILATDLSTNMVYKVGRLSGASLNPSVRNSQAAKLINEKGIAPKCQPPIMAFWRNTWRRPASGSFVPSPFYFVRGLYAIYPNQASSRPDNFLWLFGDTNRAGKRQVFFRSPHSQNI